MKNSLTSIGLTILPVVFAFFYISGVIHSCNKHSDSDMIRYSPIAVYRGVEMFWHDDFRGVDWDQKLKSDAFVLFQFMTTTYPSEVAETFSNELDNFGEKVRKYPKKNYLF